jgi:hypothetical protein
VSIASVINIIGSNVSPALEEKFAYWVEAYALVNMTIPYILGVDTYKINEENPLYPKNISVYHGQNLQELLKAIVNPARLAVVKDVNTTFKNEVIWYRKGYELVKSFRSDTQLVQDTRVDNAQVLDMEVLNLTTEEEETYNRWLTRWAYPVYIPILMRLPGLKAYNCFHHSGQDYQESKDYPARETEYPGYISMLYFEDIKAFRNYERSPELVAFREAVRVKFPGSYNHKWYIQYQLVKSWRK